MRTAIGRSHAAPGLFVFGDFVAYVAGFVSWPSSSGPSPFQAWILSNGLAVRPPSPDTATVTEAPRPMTTEQVAERSRSGDRVSGYTR